MQIFKNNPDRFSFLSQATEKEREKYGYLMWFCLFIGYFTFCLNWIIMGKLQGGASEGWAKDFGLDPSNDSLKLEASMYAVSLARGCATLGVAYLMVKVSHKYAVILALALNSIALPLIFFGYYSLFVIGRMLMACGGTMLIILVQPILTRFFNLKQKGILTTLTSMAYLLGALVANLIFIYQGTNESFLKTLRTNWKLIAGLCAGLSYFPLIAYPIIGKNFLTSDNMQQDIDQTELPKNTYKGIIKEKKMWLWIVLYSFLLAASLVVSLSVPKILVEPSNHAIASHFKEPYKKAGLSWSSIYTICFYVGCMCGMCMGIWNKKKYRRKPFVILAFALSLFFLAVIIGCAHWKNVAGASSIIFISVFLFAFFAMGIQPVILYIPHEYEENDNAKRITIFYSYLWGFGYIIFTLYQIILAAISSGIKQDRAWGYLAIGFIFLLIFGAFSCALFIKEPRPEYALHPWQKETNNSYH